VDDANNVVGCDLTGWVGGVKGLGDLTELDRGTGWG